MEKSRYESQFEQKRNSGEAVEKKFNELKPSTESNSRMIKFLSFRAIT